MTDYFPINKKINDPIRKVDSIGYNQSIASPFGKIYSQSMANIAMQTQSMDSMSGLFINQFETSFADYFINAFLDYENGNLPETSDWNCFFSNPAARPWQLVLLGVNTHINADMWRSLVSNFSCQEIQKNKKQFLACQVSVTKTYRQFFETLLMESSYLRFVDSFTKGLPRKLGEMIVCKWRRRSVNLAILYYTAPEKFKRRFAKVKRKKAGIDKLILRQKYKLA